MKWEMVRINKISTLVTKGTTPSTLGDDMQKNGIPFLRAQNINNGKVIFDNGLLYINKATDDKLKRSKIQSNDVLITIAGTIGRTAVVPKLSYTLNCNQAIAIIRPINTIIFPKYLNYVLTSQLVKNQILGAKVTATIPNLSLTQIKNLKIPLPPLTEQKRIAQLLDTADALRQKDKALLAGYDELLESVFLEMFGDIGFNVKKWEERKIRDLVTGIIGGHSYGGEERPLKEDELGVLKVSAATLGYFRPIFKAVSKNLIKKSIITIRKEDVLFSRANTKELVGATCMVDKNYDNLFIPDKLWRIDLKEDIVNKYFFWMVLNNASYKHRIRKKATGTSGSMLNISKEKLKDTFFPIPPISLQNKFAEIVQNIEAQKENVRLQLKESEDLFGALMQEVFG